VRLGARTRPWLCLRLCVSVSDAVPAWYRVSRGVLSSPLLSGSSVTCVHLHVVSPASARPLCRACVADLTLVIQPAAPKWSAFVDGELVLQRLDYDSIRIVNSCLAQTVNLQYFEAKVGHYCLCSCQLYAVMCW
jgi:hypothetical protein